MCLSLKATSSKTLVRQVKIVIDDGESVFINLGQVAVFASA